MIYASALLTVATLAVSAQAKSVDLDSYNFEAFVKEHKHSWKGEELVKRQAIFEAELTRVKEHNAANKSWKEGINKFSALTKSEKKINQGYNKHSAVAHEAKYEQPFDLKLLPVSHLPKNVDWRKHEPNVVTSVKDQGHCECFLLSSGERILV